MHPALASIDHRPWPLPPHPWKWRQSWLDVAFLHYRIEADRLQERLPDGLRVQQFDGSAWLGLVPFTMSGVTRRPFPALAGFSSFPELNVRTYVEAEGKPGVWFLSLDADSWPAVLAGRHLYNMPYFSARIHRERQGDWHHFSSVRRSQPATLSARYRPRGEIAFPKPGTFEHWAVERYCLYSVSGCGAVSRIEVHHAPWALQPAEADVQPGSIFSSLGLAPKEGSPLCHFSSGVHAITFAKKKLSNRTRDARVSQPHSR